MNFFKQLGNFLMTGVYAHARWEIRASKKKKGLEEKPAISLKGPNWATSPKLSRPSGFRQW